MVRESFRFLDSAGEGSDLEMKPLGKKRKANVRLSRVGT